MTTHKRTTYARTGTHNIIIYNATRDELPPPPPRDERAVWRWLCAHTSPRCRRTYVNCTPHTSSSVYYTIDSRQARLNPMRTLKRLHTHRHCGKKRKNVATTIATCTQKQSGFQRTVHGCVFCLCSCVTVVYVLAAHKTRRPPPGMCRFVPSNIIHTHNKFPIVPARARGRSMRFRVRTCTAPR